MFFVGRYDRHRNVFGSMTNIAFVVKFFLLTSVAIYYQLYNYPNMSTAVSMSCAGSQMAVWFWIYTIVIDLHAAVTLVISSSTTSRHEMVLVSCWTRGVSNAYYALSIAAQMLLCGYGLYLVFWIVSESCSDALRISSLGILSIDICMICIYVMSVVIHLFERYNLCFMGDFEPAPNDRNVEEEEEENVSIGIHVNANANDNIVSVNNSNHNDNSDNNPLSSLSRVQTSVPDHVSAALENEPVTFREIIRETRQ